MATSGKTIRTVLVTALVLAATAVGIVAVVVMNVTGEKRADKLPLAKVDPALRTWRKVGGFSPGLTRPQGMAAAAGKVYIAGDRAVRVFTETGQTVAEWPLPDEPSCIALAGDGRVLVGLGNRVVIYDARGRRQTGWPAPSEKAYVTAIAVAGPSVFLADSIRHVVTRHDLAGKLELTIDGRTSRNTTGFIIRSGYFDLAAAPDRLVRIVNPGLLRIEAWTVDGERRFAWGKAGETVDGFSGCCNPGNIAILPDRRIVTAEKGKAPAKVKVFEPDGPETHFGTVESVILAGDEMDDVTIALDVAIGSRGQVLVLEMTGDGSVLVFEQNRTGSDGNGG